MADSTDIEKSTLTEDAQSPNLDKANGASEGSEQSTVISPQERSKTATKAKSGNRGKTTAKASSSTSQNTTQSPSTPSDDEDDFWSTFGGFGG